MTAAPPEEPQPQVYELARFNDRFLAYFVDVSLFLAGFAATALLLGLIPSYPGAAKLWGFFWYLLYLLYHAYFNAEGRQPVGKRLLGIQVFTLDGTALSYGRSLARAAGYIPSGMFLHMGFLWALFYPNKAAWHDLMTGTQVVDMRPKSERFRKVSLGLSWCLALFLIGVWAVQTVGAPRYAQMKIAAEARRGLSLLAELQEKYHRETGAYSADASVLFKALPDREGVIAALAQSIDLGTLRLEAGKDGFSIQAQARNDRKTLVRVEGPASPKGPPK